MTQKEIVTALRCCASNGENSCKHCTECPSTGNDCESELQFAAADLIENQQKTIEALRQANEGLRFNLAAYANGERAVEDASPYAVTTDSSDGDEICRAALETFGERAQMVMAIEEMSELTKELCKHRRGRDNVEAIAEEIADVEIMLRQMAILFDCSFTVDKFRRYKLERLAERIKEKKQ